MLKTLNKFVAVVLKSIYAVASLLDKNIQKDFEIVKSSISLEEFKNPALVRVITLAEDQRFFEHKGVDIRSVIRSCYRILFYNCLEGGSTIEQQFVRMVTNKREISLTRKIREWMLAVKLCEEYSKSQILNSYLTKYVFLENNVGVAKLANFEKINFATASDKELCIIAARFKYPFVEPSNYLLLKRALRIEGLYNTKFVTNNWLATFNDSLTNEEFSSRYKQSISAPSTSMENTPRVQSVF